MKAGSIDYIPESFVRYRQRSGSITHSVNSKLCSDLTTAILSCIELAEHAPFEIRESALRYSAFQFGTFLLNQALADTPQPECIQLLKPHTQILRYHGNNKKLIVLNAGCRILGMKNMCRLIRLFYRTIRK